MNVSFSFAENIIRAHLKILYEHEMSLKTDGIPQNEYNQKNFA